MEQLKDVGAILFAATIVLLLATALIIGLKQIWNRVQDFGSYKTREREHAEELAIHKAKVKELQMKTETKELAAS